MKKKKTIRISFNHSSTNSISLQPQQNLFPKKRSDSPEHYVHGGCIISCVIIWK